VRGPLRWAQNCGAQNRGEAPSPSLRSTSPRARGEVKRHRSRDAAAPELCQRHSQRTPSEHDSLRFGRRWNRLPSRSCPANKREAERRQAHRPTSAPAGAASPLRTSPVCEGGTEGGSPVGVPPRLLPTGVSPRALLQASLPGTWSGRALPALSCPSPVKAPHAPAVVPERKMPGAARERTANPRAGTALALPSGLPLEDIPR
jgi:hypothetical protein